MAFDPLPSMASLTTEAVSSSKTVRSPGGETSPPGPTRAALIVWGIWALMVLAALAFDWRYAVPIPFGDELLGVPLLAGHPLTLQGLWEAHNGQHRLPFPKLILLVLHTLTGYSFFAVAFFNPLALGAMAAGMIWVARRLRGRTSYLDAFFPLALLHFGQGDNLLISWEVVFVVPVMVTVGVLLILVRLDAQRTFLPLLAAGLGIALHPFCGGPGVPYAPGLALWLGYAAVLHGRRPERGARLQAVVLLILAAATGLLTLLYFQGIEQCTVGDVRWQSRGWRMTVRAAVQFLSMGFGPCGPRLTLTYISGEALLAFWKILGLGVLVLTILSSICLVTVWWQRPSERLRASALLCFLVGAGGLALGIGHSRGGASADYIISENRYCLLAAPLLCCLLFIWQIYGWPGWRSAVQGGLVLFMGLLLPFNMYLAPDEAGIGDNHIGFILGLRQFERDMRAGLPLTELLTNYEPILGYGLDRATLLRLHRDQVGPFRYLREDPPFHEEILAPAAVSSNSRIAFSKPRLIYGVHLAYTPTSPETPLPVPVKVFWKGPGCENWIGGRENDHGYFFRSEGKQLLMVWVEDQVTDLRLDWGAYANAIDLTVTLLVPPDP